MAYSEEERKAILDEICERVMNLEAVRNILKDKHMPAFPTLIEWLDADEEKAKQYARAIQLRADVRFENIANIVNEDCRMPIYNEAGEVVGYKTDAAKVQHQRLKFDAERWQASKENSKKYGDRIINDNHNINENKEISEDRYQEILKKLNNK